MARDLTVLRHSVEQIAVKQERLAAAQEQLEQLAAKQEQMAQDIAKLQAVGQNIRQKLSPRPLSRTVPVSPSRNAPKEPKDTPPETAAQSSSVPRPEPTGPFATLRDRRPPPAPFVKTFEPHASRPPRHAAARLPRLRQPASPVPYPAAAPRPVRSFPPLCFSLRSNAWFSGPARTHWVQEKTCLRRLRWNR